MAGTPKRLRFEAFKRDGFKCSYCGRTPPAVVLECDHIIPVSDGGQSILSNLLTACFDCNRGKSNVPLNHIPKSLADGMAETAEREEQLKYYRELMDGVEKRIKADCASIAEIWDGYYRFRVLSENIKNVTVRKFIERLPIHIVQQAMRIAIEKFPGNNSDSMNSCVKYFCGICWNKIRETSGKVAE